VSRAAGSAAGMLVLHILASDGLESLVGPSDQYYISLVSYAFFLRVSLTYS